MAPKGLFTSYSEVIQKYLILTSFIFCLCAMLCSILCLDRIAIVMVSSKCIFPCIFRANVKSRPRCQVHGRAREMGMPRSPGEEHACRLLHHNIDRLSKGP